MKKLNQINRNNVRTETTTKTVQTLDQDKLQDIVGGLTCGCPYHYSSTAF